MASPAQENLATSKAHQWLTLVGAGFVAFEVIFIQLYSDNFWFTFDLRYLGLPAVVFAAVLAHFVLLFLQSRAACRATSALFKGKPPVSYTRWLTLDDEGFGYGLRYVRWQSFDEAHLSFFGNLILRSRVICGDKQKEPDIIFKFPFSPASQAVQHKFIEKLKAANPGVAFNQRLIKRLDSPVVRGQNFVQATGALMMSVLLLDLGYSSFYYLEMLKHYYLAEVAGLSGQQADAEKELTAGDFLRAHPLPVSYITTRFLTVGNCAAGVAEARGEALWSMGKKSDALSEAKKAIDYSPDSFRLYLQYARLLYLNGENAAARDQLMTAIDKHKDSLLPRLYLLAQAKESKPQAVPGLYRMMLQDLNERAFEGEPHWPPGGDTFVHDIYYSKDVYFVFNRLLGVDLKPPPQN
jgi:tetratricopeptide (TPR) repeat protein